MRRRSRALLSLVLFVAGLGLLVVGHAGPSSAAAANCNSDGTITADALVIIKNIAYNPAEVDLPGPGTVCWWHQDGTTPHTVTMDGGPGVTVSGDPNPNCSTSTPDDCFNEGDQPIVYSFTTAGTYNYHCRIHSSMHGVIKVAGTIPTGPGGTTATTARKTTTTTAAGGTTSTTVGTLTPLTTTTTVFDVGATTTTTTAGASTTTTALGSATTIFSGTKKKDDKPSGVLEAAGVILLAASAAALIPGWRRLT